MSRVPVQARGGGYGLDAELAQRAAERYDYDMEDEAREWVETITGSEIGDDFGEGLRDGVLLCQVANKIKPGVVPYIETKSRMPFKLMENISSFLRACRTLGVNEFDLFETVDLFELKDLGHVVRCLFALGRAVQRNYPDFDGPTLGVKESMKNTRQFSSDQIAQARNAPSQMSLGSSRTMKMDHSGSSNRLTFGADALRTKVRAPPPPPPPSADKIEMVSRVRKGEDLDGPVSPAKSPDVDAVVDQWHGMSGLNSASEESGEQYEKQVQDWIERVTGDKFSSDSFAKSLQDGVLLCRLINTIKPDAVTKVHQSQMPFKRRENISNFLKAIRTVGVQDFFVFTTDDLYNEKNIDQVVKCLFALDRAIAQNVPEYAGPRLGQEGGAIAPSSPSIETPDAIVVPVKTEVSPEDEVKAWISQVTNEPVEGELMDALKDGTILCKLVNTIQPGVVAKVQESSMPFKQRENIQAFLRACRTIGVQEYEVCETVDLYEQKNPEQVIKCLYALGRAVQKNLPGYDGPKLGVRESTPRKREFSDAQMREARSAVPMWTQNSMNMERGGVDRSNSITFRADAARNADKVVEKEETNKEEEEEEIQDVGESSASQVVGSETSTTLPTRTVWS